MTLSKSGNEILDEWRINPKHLYVIEDSQRQESKNFFDKNRTLYRDLYKHPEKDAYTVAKDIIRNRIQRLKIKTILDVGCGAGTPMIEYLKLNYQIKGIDFSAKQLEVAKGELKKNGFNPDLVTEADIENELTLPKENFDCIISVGVFPHLVNSSKALVSFVKMLNEKGKLFIQFKNALFSMFSLNKYSYEFFTHELIDMDSLGLLQKDVDLFLRSKFSTQTENFEFDVLSKYDNPLTISNLFEPLGLQIDKIHFFHYHIAPPILENVHPKLFRKLGYSIENSNDWRGYFLASSFIVEASNYHRLQISRRTTRHFLKGVK